MLWATARRKAIVMTVTNDLRNIMLPDNNGTVNIREQLYFTSETRDELID